MNLVKVGNFLEQRILTIANPGLNLSSAKTVCSRFFLFSPFGILCFRENDLISQLGKLFSALRNFLKMFSAV